MRHKAGQVIQFPGYYRHDLILWRMSQTGLTPKIIAQQSKQDGRLSVSEDTVCAAMNGDCGTIKKLWTIASILRLKFSELFNFDLLPNEFDRAVLNGHSGLVRSEGRTVGESARSISARRKLYSTN